MIISASYKTDIPTFYGEWFMNRLRKGGCKMVNPYNQQVYEVKLTPDTVDGFVFWTKNIGPFLKHLPEVKQRGYPFIVQHTVNGYPRELEFKVINYSHTIEHMKKLASVHGPEVVVWRYDPIIISSLTPPAWHSSNFERLARSLQGTTDEVVVSFGQIYKKTKRNMDWAADKFGFDWKEHVAMSETMPDECVLSLIRGLAQIAQSYGMQLKMCSQKAYLIEGVVTEARCVDADRLERVSHKSPLDKTKQKGNRKECGCYASKDIGEYDTCPHGCVYCYAVQNRDLALSRYKEHDPDDEFLFPPKHYDPSLDKEQENAQIIPAPKPRNAKRTSGKQKNGGIEVEQQSLF